MSGSSRSWISAIAASLAVHAGLFFVLAMLVSLPERPQETRTRIVLETGITREATLSDATDPMTRPVIPITPRQAARPVIEATPPDAPSLTHASAASAPTGDRIAASPVAKPLVPQRHEAPEVIAKLPAAETRPTSGNATIAASTPKREIVRPIDAEAAASPVAAAPPSLGQVNPPRMHPKREQRVPDIAREPPRLKVATLPLAATHLEAEHPAVTPSMVANRVANREMSRLERTPVDPLAPANALAHPDPAPAPTVLSAGIVAFDPANTSAPITPSRPESVDALPPAVPAESISVTAVQPVTEPARPQKTGLATTPHGSAAEPATAEAAQVIPLRPQEERLPSPVSGTPLAGSTHTTVADMPSPPTTVTAETASAIAARPPKAAALSGDIVRDTEISPRAAPPSRGPHPVESLVAGPSLSVTPRSPNGSAELASLRPPPERALTEAGPHASIMGREPLPPQTSIARLIADYEGDGCFAALAASDGGTARVRITALAASRERLKDFASLLSQPEHRGSPREPQLSTERIGPAQCRALSFLANAPGYPAYGLRLRLASRLVESGTHLLGRIEGARPDDTLEVLLVDDEGLVQPISTFLKRNGDKARFSVPITMSGETVETAQIVLALALPEPLIHGQQAGGVPADRFFSDLAEATAAHGARAQFALDYFILQTR